ncbi:conjugal transfer protein TraD [Igneacidithiobacillus copahuensis]|nr:conjugal transfer protein TraD [Igneacidithiobacillus copahuensis]
MTQEMQAKWLADRMPYLRGLKAPSDQQRLLMMLADKKDRTAADERKLAALVRAEKAQERAQKAHAAAARIVNAEKASERKARDHELYKSAGLLILSGLVDTRTGKPTRDRGELLGALFYLNEAMGRADDEKRAVWKSRGDAEIAARSAKQEITSPDQTEDGTGKGHSDARIPST